MHADLNFKLVRIIYTLREMKKQKCMSILLVEETGGPAANDRPVASH